MLRDKFSNGSNKVLAAAAAAMALGFAPAAQADLVYSFTSFDGALQINGNNFRDAGDDVTLGAGGRNLTSITIGTNYFFDRANGYTGYTPDLTLTVYGMGAVGTDGYASVIATSTAVGVAFAGADGSFATQAVTFLFAGEVVPDSFILGVRQNNPGGNAGDAFGLNYGLGAHAVGSSDGSVFRCYPNSPAPGASDCDTLTFSAPFALVADIVTAAAVPEPGTLALVGLSVAGLGLSRRRRA